ncbi:MAG: hypothetical protein F6K24_19385, partial [Okeania sp. SIO2D1]|nr:hypothetical protein [Okeania sp. SIO2D1]
SSNDELSRVYQEGRRARDLLLADLEQEMEAASAGAPPPQSFAAKVLYTTQRLGKTLNPFSVLNS